MLHKLLPRTNLISLLLCVGQFKFQVFDCDSSRLEFRVGSRLRQRITLVGGLNSGLYCIYQIFRLSYSISHASIEQTALDLVWIIGSFTSCFHSCFSLIRGHRTAEFVSTFLRFIDKFNGRLLLCSYYVTSSKMMMHLIFIIFLAFSNGTKRKDTAFQYYWERRKVIKSSNCNFCI